MSLVSIATATDTKGGGGSSKSVVEHDDDDDDDEEDTSGSSSVETMTEAVATGSGNIAESGDVIKTLSVQKPRNAKNQTIFLVNFKDELYLPVKADEKEMTKFRLIQPKLLEENAGPFACTYCDKKFRFNSKLKRHIGIHTGIKPFQCDYCSSRFSQIAGLRRHLITHTGRTAYQCRICEKYCSSSVELKRHLRTHTDEGFYQCEYCTKNYLQLRSLKRHILQHEHVRKYPCKLCDAFFPGKIFLDAHYRQHSRQQSINITYGLPFDHNTYVAVPNSVADRHASAVIANNNNRDFKIILKPTGAFDQPEAVLVANAFCDQPQQQQQRRLMGEQTDGQILIRTTGDMNGSPFSADPTIGLNGAGDIGVVEDGGAQRTILICDDDAAAGVGGDASSLAAALNMDGQQNIVITDSASNVIINELLYSSSDNVKIVYSAEDALPSSVLLNGYDGPLTAESGLCRNELYQTMAIVTTSGTGNNDCFARVADSSSAAELDVETTTTTTTTTTVVQQNAGNIVVDAASVLLNSFAIGEDNSETIIDDGAGDVALISSFENGNSNLSGASLLQDDEKPIVVQDEQSTVRKSNVAVQVESGGDNNCDYYVQEFAAAADQLFMFDSAAQQPTQLLAGDDEQRLDVKKERDTVIMLNQSLVTTLSSDTECTEFQLLADDNGQRSNQNEEKSIVVAGTAENRFQLLNEDNDDDGDGVIDGAADDDVVIKNEESDLVYEDGFDEDSDVLFENDAIAAETDLEKVPIDSDGGLVGMGQEEIIAVAGASAITEDYMEHYRDDSDGDNIYAIMNNVNYLVERSDIESFSCQLDDDDDHDDIDVLEGSAVSDACDEQIAIVTTSAAGFATVDDEEEETVDFSLEENYEESCTVQHLRQNLFAAESSEIGNSRVNAGTTGIVLSNETLSNNTTYIAINDSSLYSNSSETIFNHFQSDSNLYIVQQSSATLATTEPNNTADGAGHLKSSIAIVKNGQIYLID